MEATTLAVMAVIFAATAARAAVGFGDALVAMPLLVLAVGIRTATPLVALASGTISIFILARDWRKVDFRAAWRLTAATVVGIPFGLFLLTRAPAPVVKGVLGGMLIVFGLYNLIGPRLPELKDDRHSWLFGLVAGVLGGAYNTNGPPVVAYGMLRRWPPDGFRATLCGYFLASGVAVLAGHAAAGLWTAEVFRWYLYSLPAVAAGLLIGNLLHRAASPARFEQAVNVFLVAMGVLLLW